MPGWPGIRGSSYYCLGKLFLKDLPKRIVGIERIRTTIPIRARSEKRDQVHLKD
jgi:hypothetical protein